MPAPSARIRRLAKVATLVAAGLVCAEWLAPRPTLAPSDQDCAGGVTGLVVDADAQRMTLCDAGRAVDGMRVRLGWNGIDKRAEGDRRTPTGEYGLGDPRPSQSGFGTFIPVAYPTAEQVAQGYTGSAIGVHGPHRLMRPVFGSTLVQWAMQAWRPNSTLGCIAVDTDAEMARVAAFVEAQTAPLIVIRSYR